VSSTQHTFFHNCATRQTLPHSSWKNEASQNRFLVGARSSQARLRSRGFLGEVGVGFLTTLESESDFFVWLRLRMSNWIISYITLLNWEFLLKMYNFFSNFCLNRDLLLCTTISIDFNRQNFIPFVLRSGSRKSWKGRSRESEVLERLEPDNLPPTPQPCSQGWICLEIF